MLEIKPSTMPAIPSLGDPETNEFHPARQNEDAYQKALEHMVHQEAYGYQKRVGRYVVGFAVEQTDWARNFLHGRLTAEQPQDENLHVEITIQDRIDGHFIPGLNVYATLVDSDGKEIGTHKQPFLWHPWLFHYGRNWKIPGDGKYTLKVRAEAPEFMKRDPLSGRRIAKAIEVEFTEVYIEACISH